MAALLWSLWVWVTLSGALAAAPAPPASDDPMAAIEDPRRLAKLAGDALREGRRDDAKGLYERSLSRMEVTQYLDYRPVLRDALVLERMGDLDESAAKYREAMKDDPLRTAQVLRIVSMHPKREELVAEVYAHVRSLVDAAKRGEKAVIYVTSKGEPRYLEPMTVDQVVANARAGTASKYCWVEDLDFADIGQETLSSLETIQLDRCVVGRIFGPELQFRKLVLKAFVLGDVKLGKTFEGEKNKSKTLQPSKFEDLVLRDSVFLGDAHFAAIEISPGRAYFPMVVFEGEADFKGAEFSGVTEFRFSSFGKGANFRLMRMYQPVYFGGTRFRADTVFSSVYSERDLYFNEARFEGAVSFERCEFQRGATFENSWFEGPASFGNTVIVENFNLSRAVFRGPVNVKEVEAASLDALGVQFRDDASFMDAVISGRARFSLDDVTRSAFGEDLDGLLGLYRHYQGDEDLDEPLTRQSSYGVESLDDLNARVEKNISFANTVFGGFTVFEGVTFGQPGQSSVASFFNTQFLGETHFERTTWNSRADFTTIFGNEVAFNNARFERSLVLDDAAVAGRLTMTDATFADDATLSFYGSEIASFQVDPSQVEGVGRPHRLFYEACALGELDRDDIRVVRLLQQEPGLDDDGLRRACYDFAIDEFVALKSSYGDRAMTAAEDDAYWWARHHDAMRDVRYGSFGERIRSLLGKLLLFELCFGWGVRLGNLGIAALLVTVTYAGLYRVFCAETVLSFDGEDMKIKDVPFIGLCYVSLQAMIAVNTGWDFGDDDNRFRFLNVTETVLGFIILTFFVGAYTRMILA